MARRGSALDVPDEAQRADALLETLIDDEAQRWVGGARDLLADDSLSAAERARRCVRQLLEATQLDREALARDEDEEFEPPMAQHRQVVRAELERILGDEPPDEATRDGWARELIDVADVVLTSIDELDPRRAARHLQFVVDDLVWHLSHVEKRRGPLRRRLKRKLRRLRIEVQEPSCSPSSSASSGLRPSQASSVSSSG